MNKSVKKIISILLVVMLVFASVSCISVVAINSASGNFGASGNISVTDDESVSIFVKITNFFHEHFNKIIVTFAKIFKIEIDNESRWSFDSFTFDFSSFVNKIFKF